MLDPCPESQFWSQGGIFVEGNDIHCFWGEISELEKRPSGPCLYVTDFFLKTKAPWKVFESHQVFSVEDFLTRFFVNVPLSLGLEWQREDAEVFSRQFSWIQQQIEDGSLAKCVPFVFHRAQPNEDREAFLRHCLYRGLQRSDGTVYGFWDRHSCIVGCSPESLVLQQNSSTYETMALAGTVEKSVYASSPEAFLSDVKESSEHEWVSSDISRVLSEFGEVSKGDRVVAEAGSLVHLKTPFVLKSKKSFSLEELIESLHPTPALGCFPREGWQATLNEMSPYSWRGRYGAPFGISQSQDQASIVVAIRNVQVHENQYLLGTGCGVVSQSQESKEWDELRWKFDSVLERFQL